MKTKLSLIIFYCIAILNTALCMPEHLLSSNINNSAKHLAPQTNLNTQTIEELAQKEIETLSTWLQNIPETIKQQTPKTKATSNKAPTPYLSNTYAKRLASYYRARLLSRSAYGTRIEPIEKVYIPNYDFYTRIITEQEGWEKIAATYGITKEIAIDQNRLSFNNQFLSKTKQPTSKTITNQPPATLSLSNKTIKMYEMGQTVKESFPYLSLAQIKERIAIFRQAVTILTPNTEHQKKLRTYNEVINPEMLLLKHFFNELIFSLEETLQTYAINISSNNTLIYQAA